MSQVSDMYRMVKLVNQEVVRMDRLEPQSIEDTGNNFWQAAISSVIKRYVKHRPWLVITDALHVAKDCIE
ncbi:MAG: hypothetical protein V4678_03330, partial [Patescibacteria group bacterium]